MVIAWKTFETESCQTATRPMFIIFTIDSDRGYINGKIRY